MSKTSINRMMKQAKETLKKIKLTLVCEANKILKENKVRKDENKDISENDTQ